MGGIAVRETGVAPTLMHVFPSFAAGGAQMRFVTLANHFGSQFRHIIVALDGDITCQTRLDPRLEVRFPVWTQRGTNFKNLRAIRVFLRQMAPDLLITSNWGSMDWVLASRLTGLAHIHAEDGFGPEERDRQMKRRVITRRLMLRHSRVILPSRQLVDIARNIWKLPAERVSYIPNGVDLRRFVPRTTEMTDPLPVIGCVAALRPEKNLARLLRAAALTAQAIPIRLLIVGDGPERHRLTALAAELALNIEFAGNIADTAAFYRRMTIFALASDTEQMPLSILEAMASGLPIAATAVGDIGTMIAASNRPYLTARDDEALSQALDALLANPAHAKMIGDANRARVEELFSETRMIEAWFSVIMQALKPADHRSIAGNNISGPTIQPDEK